MSFSPFYMYAIDKDKKMVARVKFMRKIKSQPLHSDIGTQRVQIDMDDIE